MATASWPSPGRPSTDTTRFPMPSRRFRRSATSTASRLTRLKMRRSSTMPASRSIRRRSSYSPPATSSILTSRPRSSAISGPDMGTSVSTQRVTPSTTGRGTAASSGRTSVGIPDIRPATVYVEDRSHPSTDGLPERWQRTDEWYDFRSNPRATVQVLARLDEATYQGGGMGTDHPIAWYHAYDGGRAWYTAGGHTRESYSEPAFLQHLLGEINRGRVAPAAMDRRLLTG